MERQTLTFYGGAAGTLAPLFLFLGGVAALGLAGAPDERGFWPVLLAAFALGLFLARDRHAYAEAYLRGMSQPIVMTMVVAWLLAGVLGSLIGASELVPTLTSLVARAGIGGAGYVVAAFLVCALVSTATGTSLGTILVCAPLLYPAGGALGASAPPLIGAILAGATFGDNVSPVSDTTIASASTQGAPMGEVVRSRLGYALPAAALAIVVFVAIGGTPSELASGSNAAVLPSPRSLAMLAAPAASILLLLRRHHLVEGLLSGALTAVAVGLAFGLIGPGELLSIHPEAFAAHGLVLDGMERAVGISIFTLLLMGLVRPIEETGLLDRWLSARDGAGSPRTAELRIFGAVSAAVLLTTHSVVAILTTGKLARDIGDIHDIPRARRANLLDVTVCTYPFLLPFFIPTILAASQTASAEAAGMPRVTPLAAGLHNAYSWALLVALLSAMVVRSRRAGVRSPRS